MTDTDHFKTRINARIAELAARIESVDTSLDQPLDRDLEDQAIDLEDDEVLESLGHAAQREIELLTAALQRIEDGTYGICRSCGDPIADARLEAVLYAPLCRTCANAA